MSFFNAKDVVSTSDSVGEPVFGVVVDAGAVVKSRIVWNDNKKTWIDVTTTALKQREKQRIFTNIEVSTTSSTKLEYHYL